MNEEYVLTKESIEKLLGEGCEELCDFTAMDDAAASAVAATNGMFSFPDIRRLSGSQARILSAHKGGLSFTALHDLSVEAASCLAASRGDLELAGPGIANADTAVVQALAAHAGGRLRLGLARITEQAARALAGRGGCLELPELEILPESAADLLATCEGPLSINESLLGDSCDLHRRLARHPSIWVSPLTICEEEIIHAAEGKDPESVVTLADSFSFFAGSCDYYGDVTEDVLKMFCKAARQPVCSVNGLWLGEEYKGRTFYFVGTKKQVLGRIAGLP